MNKYLCILICILCATSTSFAKKKKAPKAVEEAPAAEQVEEQAAEAPSEEVAADPEAVEAPAEEAKAEAPADETATEEVAEESDGEEEVVADDDSDDEAVTKSKKKKKSKKKSKKKKSKKKKKHVEEDEEEYSSDEDEAPANEGFTGLAYGAHVNMGLASYTDWNNYGGALDIGLSVAYYFTPKMSVRSGLDLEIGAVLSKETGYSYSFYGVPTSSYSVNSTAYIFSLSLPVVFRYTINDMWWAEAGVRVTGNFYSIVHLSSDCGESDAYASLVDDGFDADTRLSNAFIGGGVSAKYFDLGIQLGYVESVTFGINMVHWFR